MDAVPLCFIQSVLRISSYYDRGRTQHLSDLWGRLGAELAGWEHMEKRTLSPEVLKEISKSITAFEVDAECRDYEIVRRQKGWHFINHDDHLLKALLGLGAPDKILDLTRLRTHCRYLEIRQKCAHLFKQFTSLHLRAIEHEWKLLKEMASKGQLRSVRIHDIVPSSYVSRFWVDYFFSESCERLDVRFEDISVYFEIINRWKQMDPWTVASYKILSGMEKTSRWRWPNVNMYPIHAQSIDTTILKKINHEVSHVNWESFYRIDHPANSSSKIYVVVLKEWSPYMLGDCFLFFA
uniref:F-box domain-containing protein n=1 Tax=Steinernema glaseri TaxID=37863 RepID=A0A1I7YKP6_9BILA